MQRRNFLQSVGMVTVLSPFIDNMNWNAYSTELVADRLSIFIAKNDKSVSSILTRQQMDKSHPFYGGFPDQFDIYHPISPAGYSAPLIAAFISPTSEYFHSSKIVKSLNLGIDFLLKRQHSSGNIDLLSTNFNSPPDTAFAVEHLSQSLMVLKKWNPDELLDFQKKAALFLKKAGDAISVGGIHTPNHRWVVCRALARLYALFPNKKYLNRIQEWLGEGIDIDPDGQYTEKSSVGYSPMVDECFITVARLLNKPELYAPVRKNLDMMLYFVHANGEVVTEASKRQDQYQIDNMRRYYFAYRYMAILDDNPLYAAMANSIESTVGVESLSGNLIHFLELAKMSVSMPEATKLPTNYIKHFPYSKMVRIRKEQVDATVLGENYNFFTFFKGNAALQAVRLASSFFGKGQFVSSSLKVENGKYILSQELVGPYYQPHLEEDISPDGNWHKMPRKNRPKSEIQYLKSVISISQENGQFSIHFDIKGTDHVPLAIELAFRPGGQLMGVEKVPKIDNAYILEKGFGQYQVADKIVEFGPGQRAHSWTQLRGAKPKLQGDSVYLTGYTPFEFTLKVW